MRTETYSGNVVLSRCISNARGHCMLAPFHRNIGQSRTTESRRCAHSAALPPALRCRKSGITPHPTYHARKCTSDSSTGPPTPTLDDPFIRRLHQLARPHSSVPRSQPQHHMAQAGPTFSRVAAEFLSDVPAAATNPRHRQWVSDAEAVLSSGRREYPPGVIASTPSFSVLNMRRLLDNNDIQLRDTLYALFKQPDFHPVHGETLEQERARTVRMWARVASLGLLENTISSGTPEGRAKYEAIIESVGILSHSLDIKMSVHYGLFGATIALMGDDQQAKRWGPRVEACEMLGCFALTELGHGSNARAIQTVATYNVSTQMFDIHTPNEEAQKYWIGGAFRSARWTVCFAQLIVAGVNHGVHPFLVRIRSEHGTAVKGVTLADCGHKCGLNGVDNGRIWFDHVTVPWDNMLRRNSRVSKDGQYSSRFKSADERFGASLASLSGGRVSVASGCLNQAKIGLTIAVRYALSRRAFGPPGEEEVRLLDYQSHQYRLIPPLATTFVMNVVLNQLKKKWHNQQLGRELHEWSSGFKALITWHSLETLQEAREACGGQGYKSENRIGPIKNGHDVALTYEGDNHILLQAVTKTVLSEFLRGVKNSGVFRGHFLYLNDRAALQRADISAMDPRSLRFAQTVMRRREAAVFARLMAELQKKQGAGMSGVDAFNSCAILVEEAARAHVHLLFVEIFYRKLAELEQQGEREIVRILSTCGALFTLKTIDSSTVFVRNGAVSPRVADTVHHMVFVLCQELRPHVLDLVNSFGLPPHLLAPIAFDYVSHNSRARL